MDRLSRFRDAQKTDYDRALNEIRNGRKQTHWMWYIFPQISGLGQSFTSRFYSIGDIEEAEEYLADEELGKRLLEISGELLRLPTRDAGYVMGSPDDMKLRSCMTLFKAAAERMGDPDGRYDVFGKVLDRYFGGKPDTLTLDLIDDGRSEP